MIDSGFVFNHYIIRIIFDYINYCSIVFSQSMFITIMSPDSKCYILTIFENICSIAIFLVNELLM